MTDAVRQGVLFAYFHGPCGAANSVVHRVPDPITNRYRFKLGREAPTSTPELRGERSGIGPGPLHPRHVTLNGPDGMGE